MPTNRVDFDEYTKEYNTLLRDGTAFFSKDDTYFAEYKVRLAQARTSRPVRRVLEYGCGIGRNIPSLRRAFPGAEVVGTDISQASLEQARQANPGVEFLAEGEAAAHLGGFDLIFVAGVYHHVPPAERAMVSQTLHTRLAPGGSLIVFEHNPYNPITARIVSNCPYDADAVLLRPSELKRHLSQAGFTGLGGGFCLFVPPRLAWLAWLEPLIAWLPLGGQYYVQAAK